MKLSFSMGVWNPCMPFQVMLQIASYSIKGFLGTKERTYFWIEILVLKLKEKIQY